LSEQEARTALEILIEGCASSRRLFVFNNPGAPFMHRPARATGKFTKTGQGPAKKPLPAFDVSGVLDIALKPSPKKEIAQELPVPGMVFTRAV
jgi:hypothetical protein